MDEQKVPTEMGNCGEKGSSKRRWLNHVEKDLKNIGMRRWQNTVRYKNEWKKVFNEALGLSTVQFVACVHIYMIFGKKWANVLGRTF